MTCPCGKHSACVPQCALMDYPGYTVYWGEPEVRLNDCQQQSFQQSLNGVEDDGFRTAYPEMPYSPELPDVTRTEPANMWVDPSNYPSPELDNLLQEIDDYYAANDPLMAGAGDGNSPPWVETTLLDGILEQRGSRYGKFADNAEISQVIKGAFRGGLAILDMAPDQIEALEQIAAKISRIVTGDPDYVDNWDDIAGYAKLVADRLRDNPPGDDPYADRDPL